MSSGMSENISLGGKAPPGKPPLGIPTWFAEGETFFLTFLTKPKFEKVSRLIGVCLFY
jgi:hypothetical protein